MRDNKKKCGRGPRKGKGRNAANAQGNGVDDLESLVSNAAVREPEYAGYTGEGELVTLSLKSTSAPLLPRLATSKKYPDLTRAARLARQTGVKGTPEALRTLEKVVASGLVRDESLLSRITEADDSRFYDETPNNSGEEEDEEDDDEEDERAAKRFKSLDLRNRIGEVQDDDRFYDTQDEPIDGTTFGEETSVDADIARAAALDEDVDMEYVPHFHTPDQCTHQVPTASNHAERDARPKFAGYLDNWLTHDGFVVPISEMLCVHNHDYAMCAKCKGKSAVSRKATNNTWLLDSGASTTLTMDKSEFIEYEELDEPEVFRTANGVAHCEGYGTVLL